MLLRNLPVVLEIFSEVREIVSQNSNAVAILSTYAKVISLFANIEFIDKKPLQVKGQEEYFPCHEVRQITIQADTQTTVPVPEKAWPNDNRISPPPHEVMLLHGSK